MGVDVVGYRVLLFGFRNVTQNRLKSVHIIAKDILPEVKNLLKCGFKNLGYQACFFAV